MSDTLRISRLILVWVGAFLSVPALAVENVPKMWWTGMQNACIGRVEFFGSDPKRLADKQCDEQFSVAYTRDALCNVPPGYRPYYGSPSIMGGFYTDQWSNFKYGFGCSNTDVPYPPWCSFELPNVPGQCGSEQLSYVSVAPYRPKDRGKPKSCELSDVQQGNPVHIATGNKFEELVLYPASRATALRFALYYNSTFEQDGTDGFGPAWRHTFLRNVVVDPNSNPNLATVLREHGKIYTFSKSGGVWIADSDVDDKLQEIPGIGWSYRNSEDDSVEAYDSSGQLLSIADRAGVTTTLQYSDASTPPSIAPKPGLMVQITDVFGRSLQFQYDSASRVRSMIDPAGGSYAFSYGNNNNLVSITFPDTKVRTLVYNESDNVVINQDTNFAAVGNHLLTGIIDENGQRFSTYRYRVERDSVLGYRIRAFYSEHAAGANAITLAFTQEPSTIQPGATYSTTLVDALGASRTYSFQSILGQIRTTQTSQPCAAGCGAAAAATVYDLNGNPSSRTDWNGNRTDRAYDLSRNLEISRREGLTSTGAATPQTRSITTEWHGAFRLPTRIAEPLRITTYTYNGDSGLSCGYKADGVTLVPGVLCRKSIQATTDANGSQGFGASASGTARTWNYTYNANGLVLTTDGPRTDLTDTTAYTYYADDDADLGKRGNLATVTNALGHTTQITAYNAHGQPITIIDPNGLTTALAYDARLRLTSRNVGGEITNYAYDGVGQLTRVTLPDASSLSYSYDAAHRLTGIQDNLGNRVTYTLDAMGNRTQEQIFDPANQLAQAKSRVYSSLNRLFRELGAQNQTTEYGYDNQGNVTSIKDPLTRVTANTYDALNRLIGMVDPALGQTQFGYNGQDRLTLVTDPRALVTSYGVDGLGNLTQQQSPDMGTTTSSYDAAGNLLTRTDAKNQTTTYAYDALNRVTSAVFQDGSSHLFAYDQGANGLGRLTSITEQDPSQQLTGQTVYVYDVKGRVISEARTIGATTYTTAYTYDGSGRLSGMTYPSGRSVTYGFDARGRVNQIGSTQGTQSQVLVQNVQYQPFGGVKSYTFGNGQTYNRGYDTDGRVASYSLGSSQFALGYDAASRITFISDVVNPANSNTYGYDNLDRLTSAVLPGAPLAYSYDAVGNRLSKTTGSSTDTYSYSGTSNQLSSTTPASGPSRNFVHDPDGSITADGLNTYSYDARGRLVQSVGALGSTTYQVNALGQRVRKTNSSDDRIFLYDSGGRLISEVTSTGAILAEYFYLADAPVAVARDGNVSYIHTDHLNTPRLVADSTGTPVWRWDQQEPFGVNVPDENPSGLGAFEFPFRFRGQYADRETGFLYNYFRDCYDPATGRYCQSDPIGLGGGLNTYAYVRSNPLRYTDPFGLARDDGFGGERRNGGGFGPGPFDVFIPGTPTNDAFVRSIGQIGQAIKELCTPEDQCKKVLRECREICLDKFVNDPNSLPGVGSDLAGRQRRCIRECMERSNCFDF